VAEARGRRERLAKMRSLLFHQEAKLKHLARIKSKDFHRRAKRAAQAKARARLPPLLPLLAMYYFTWCVLKPHPRTSWFSQVYAVLPSRLGRMQHMPPATILCSTAKAWPPG
jgi:hypothetical protein